MTADDVIRRLALAPHPEGGFYRETWRDAPADGARGAGTAIYFLLRAGERSRWHRIDAAELWHFYAGAPLELAISRDGVTQERQRLGADLAAGERPQLVVPPGAWQSATCLAAPNVANSGRGGGRDARTQAAGRRGEHGNEYGNEPGSEPRSEGWTLVGCTVSPAFEFARFELAPEGFAPGGGGRPA
jgi:predicted cupin superfamily sugar epimerase